MVSFNSHFFDIWRVKKKEKRKYRSMLRPSIHCQIKSHGLFRLLFVRNLNIFSPSRPTFPVITSPHFLNAEKKKNSFLKNMKCYGNREIQSDGISSFKRARKPLSLLLKIPFFSFCAYVFFVFRRVFIGR